MTLLVTKIYTVFLTEDDRQMLFEKRLLESIPTVLCFTA